MLKILYQHFVNKILKNQFEAISFKFRKKAEISYELNKDLNFFNLSHKNLQLFDLEKVLKKANLIMDRKFNLLGSGEYQFNKIPWHSDFVSGYKWQLKYYKNISKYKVFKKKCNISIKLPWELSRCQHMPLLGLAFLINKNQEYLNEFIYQINDWLENNTYKNGINWLVSMEVSIRAINWIWAYQFFNISQSFSDEFKDKFFKSLYLHGRYIIDNLEGNSRGNHLISNFIGLIYLGLFFDTEESKGWRRLGYRGIHEEIRHQFKAGIHYEKSTNYHFLVVEFITSAILLAKANNIKVPEDVLIQNEKMIEFIMYYIQPDGTAPIIGDADDGRLYKIFCDDINDHRYILNIGAVLFNRSDFKIAYPQFHQMTYLLLGEDGLNKFNNIPIKEKEIKSKAYPQTGFFFSRYKDIYLLIKSGTEKKPEMSAHLHNDIFSFVLSIGNGNILIDPGTFIYSRYPEWRNRFRSTAFHNTVMIDCIEQNEFYEPARFHPHLFCLKSYDTITKTLKWDTNPEFDLFEAEHYGYQKLKDPVIHKRKIFFDKIRKQIEITDTFICKEKHYLEWLFHFEPMILEQDKRDSLIVRTKSNGFNIELALLNKKEEMVCVIMGSGFSRNFGVKQKNKCVKYLTNVNGTTEYKFLLDIKRRH